MQVFLSYLQTVRRMHEISKTDIQIKASKRKRTQSAVTNQTKTVYLVHTCELNTKQLTQHNNKLRK